MAARDFQADGKAEALIASAKAKDWTTLSIALLVCNENVRRSLHTWIREALANKFSEPTPKPILLACDKILTEVTSPRLAARAAVTLLASQ